jgi:hypothetical protein
VTKVITLPEARGLLARAVLTMGPDFVHNTAVGDGIGCLNIPFGDIPEPYLTEIGAHDIPEDSPKRKTGCLVATALSFAGLDRFAERVAAHPQATVVMFKSELTKEAYDYLGEAQGLQDNGASWGAAYAHVEGKLRKD